MLSFFLIACADPYALPEDAVFTVGYEASTAASEDLETGATEPLEEDNTEALTQDSESETSSQADHEEWDFEDELAGFEPTSEELVLIELINKYRMDKDLPELSYIPEAALLARTHSENMAYGEIGVTHEQYGERFSCLTSALPIQAMAENVGLAFLREHSTDSDEIEEQLLEQFKAEPFSLDETSVRTLQALVQNWVDSMDHEYNILGDFEWTGVGVVVAPLLEGEGTGFYATQIFLRPN